METVTVHVVKYRDRKNLVMRYVCPTTGRQVQRSAGTPLRSQAEKLAAKWEAELQEGRYQRDARMPWDDFRRFWEETKALTLKAKSAANYASTLNAFEELCRPQRLADLTTARVTTFASELRKPRKRKTKKKRESEEEPKIYTLTEASVAKHLRCLKAVARWAHRQGMLAALPTFDMPKSRDAARMKGRPITGEELDRMLVACESVVGQEGADSWKLLLRGIWTSGLRLSEVLALRWDHRAGAVSVALDGKRSVLLFDGGAQKNGKAEAVALAPEAVELLAPLRKDSGHVFDLVGSRGEPASRRVLAVGRRIAAIGKAAGVVTDSEKGRTATAHDLRRAFGYRWSRRVMPATLKALMRHSSIDTTMTYYVGENAKATAAELWAAVPSDPGTISGTSGGASNQAESTAHEKTPA